MTPAHPNYLRDPSVNAVDIDMPGIALIGCGTVGTAVVEALAHARDRLARVAGEPVTLRHVCVRDPNKPRSPNVPPQCITTNPADILNDPATDIVVELVGGTTHAGEFVADAIVAGKHVVTANKALLAERGPEFFAAARQRGVCIAFEAAVCGGIPIINATRLGLVADDITALYGILNGTCNDILTGMLERRLSYSDALAQAQRLGYAEADPTLDIDGTDSAQKLAILASIAMRENVTFRDIPNVRGIQDLQLSDLVAGRALGFTCKLLAIARRVPAGVQLSVRPTFIPSSHPLAKVDGPFNAVSVYGGRVGHVHLAGRGAGGAPTAAAVVADIMDIAIGSGQRAFHALGPWRPEAPPACVVPTDENDSAFYIRVHLHDRPGGMARIAQVLADENISIASLVQRSEPSATGVPVMVTTHAATDGAVHRAVDRISRLEAVCGPAVCIPTLDEYEEFTAG